MDGNESANLADEAPGYTGLLRYARRLWSYLRLTPFDTSTPEGRSRERYRRVAWTSLAGVATNGVRVGTTLISVPLTVSYLGKERFGLWMTISSVITLLSFADLGMGNGLLNAISAAHGRDDRDAARRYVSGAFFMLSGMALGIGALFAIFHPITPWPRVFNVTSLLAMKEAGPAMAVFFACFAVGLPLGVARSVQVGYQEGFANHLWAMLGALLGLGGLLVAIRLRAGLPWLVLAMSGGPVLALFLNSVVVFGWTHTALLPRWQAFDWESTSGIFGTGVLFLVLQILTLIGSSSDNLIIAHALGPSAVAGYAVVFKLFSVTLIAQHFTSPLWPAFGEAMVRKDHAWAHRALNRALVFSLAVGVAFAVPLMVLGKWIIAIWVSPDMAPSTSLLIGFAFWVMVVNYGGVMSTFLNSGPLLGRQIGFFSAATAAALLLKFILVRSCNVSGVIWATVIGFGVFYVVPSMKLAYGALRAVEVRAASADNG